MDNIYVYVDESGSITKTNVSNNRYFIISMLFTDDPVGIRRLFKNRISKLMKKNDRYKSEILTKKEIKGSDISETTKQYIYEHIIKHGSEKMELGIVVLDNQYTTDRFIQNHARTVNYLIQVYLDSYFRHHSKYSGKAGEIDFIIDEQNVATNAEYELEGYLNQQLTIGKPLCNVFKVKYTDSKNEKLVQLSDFIANSFYRNIEKKILESRDNIALWKPVLCNKDIFDFSENHDIRLNMP